MSFLFIALISLFLAQELEQTFASDCYTYLIDGTSQSFSCGSPGSFSASDLNPPSSGKELSVALSIMPTSLCSLSSNTLLSVSILPSSTSGVRKRVMMLTYDGSNIVWYSEDKLGLQQGMSQAVGPFLNQPFNLYLTVNLATGSCAFAGGGIIGNGNQYFTPASATYDSDWSFDSTLQISVCADYDGTSSIGCTIQNLKVQYYFYNTLLSVFDFANSVTMLGDYQLNQGTGTTVANSQGTLASASVSNTPAWIPGGGLSFTDVNQFFLLPNFIPSASDLTITTSLAFVLYIKIDTTPVVRSNILSYHSDPKSTYIFQLWMTTDFKIQLTMDTIIAPPSNAVAFTLGQWSQVYVSYTYTYGGYGIANAYLDGVLVDTFLETSNAYGAHGNTVFSTSDYIWIGGFPGQLRRLQVYSPAAYRLDPEPCDPSTCALEIGFSIPSTCLTPVCSSGVYYDGLGSCQDCPTGCSECTDDTTCTDCDSGYYLPASVCIECSKGMYVASLTSCLNCPMHCTSCTSSSTCQSCSSGYGIYNSICMLCPTGTYLSSKQICKEFSQTIQDTLTNSQLLNSAATQAASFISEGSVISMSASIGGKIFSQIKYLNISYSGELEVALLTWKTSFVSLGLTPDMPQSMIDEIPERHVPYVFEKYDIPSSFLENFWENLGVIVFVTFIWLFLKGAESLISQKTRIASVTRRIRVMTQNFLITALYGVYGDLVMFSIIEYRTMIFGWNLSLLSFIISVILLVTMIACFWYQTRLLLNYQKIKKLSAPDNDSTKLLLQEFAKKHEGSQVFFKDFKDYSLSPQLFIFFLTARDLLFSLILATMFEYPLPQTIIITSLDCLMITYLLIERPFESVSDAIQQMFFEIISLIVSVSVLINAILDAGDYEAITMRNNIGKLIIIVNMIFNFVTAFFMLILIIQILIEFVRGIRERRAKKIVALNIKHRPAHEIPNASQISLNKDQDSNKISLEELHPSQYLETIPHENSDLSLLPLQIQSANRNSRLQRAPHLVNEPYQAHQTQETHCQPTHHRLQNNLKSRRIKQRSPENNQFKNLSPPLLNQKSPLRSPQSHLPRTVNNEISNPFPIESNISRQKANSRLRHNSPDRRPVRQNFPPQKRLEYDQ